MRIPASAANDEPIAQPQVRSRCGRAPFVAASVSSSTTARIATPSRVR